MNAVGGGVVGVAVGNGVGTGVGWAFVGDALGCGSVGAADGLG